ncbi:MAG TPA: ABC transporter substrate-binding protein, partial [Solirubrobacterales bacterium]|nr:ABC transporter substrate-binding protein [Solirubrobacterales bacterium]
AIPANVKNLVDRENPKFAKVLYPVDDPFGQTSAETAVQAFKDEGVKVTSMQVGANGIGQHMTDERQDAFMITASSGETGAGIVKDLRNAYGAKTPILGGNAFNSPVVAESLGQQGKGVQSAAAWYAGNHSDENHEFMANYMAKYGQEPDQFAAQAYTGVKLLADAAEEADLQFGDIAADREALKTALEGVSEETPLGDFSFTPDHDVSQPIWIVQMNGKGTYDLVAQVNP